MKLESQHYSNPPGWTIVLYGGILSFVSAFTPFFTAGYLFQLELLLAGFTPYLIYGIAVPLLPGRITTVPGVILAAAHTGLVTVVRVFGASDSLMYTVPLLLAIAVTPLAAITLVKTRYRGRTTPTL